MRFVSLVVGCLAVASALPADTPPCTQVQYAGEVVLRMRVGVGDQTPEARAVEVHQRLVEAISIINESKQPFDADCVVVRRACAGTSYRHEVWFGNLRLVGVTEADADANGCCTQQLAARWARNIRRALYTATHDC